MKRLYIFILTLVVAICANYNRAAATHAAGADLTYVWLGGNQYRLEVTFYRDCGGVSEPSNVTVNVKSACGHNFNVTANKIPGTGQEITVPCQTSASTCTGGSAVGIRKFEYHATVTLPAACSLWTFSYSVCCRNCPITTIQNPCANSSLIYVESTLNNSIAPNNSSPNFSNIPIAFVCIGQTFNYNHGVLDANGDSLVYEFITPKTGATSTVTWIPPSTTTAPLSSSTPFTLNSQTGQITFTPNMTQIGVMAIRVREFRNGILIGSVIRDMQVYTSICANNLPTASGINGTNNYTTTACPGQQLCFTVNSADADASQVVTLLHNSGISGATYTVSAGPRPTLTFCWTPSEGQISPLPYTFTITVQDNACPTNGVQIFSYSIFVTAPQFTVNTTDVTCNGLNNGSASVNLTSPPPVTYLWSSGATTQNISNLSTGNYMVTVTDANGCSVIRNFYIDQPSAIVFNTAKNDITCAGLCNGSVSTTASGGTTPYSYVWSSGQTTGNVSGLCTGTYTVTLTDANGCTSVRNETIAPQSNIAASASATSNVSCYGTATGAVSLTVSGGVSPYNYVWSNGATTQSLTNVAAGTYTVTVVDNIGCTRNATATVTQPSSALDGSATVNQAVSCFGGSNGSISLTVNGGTAPYQFNWSNGATTQNLTSLVSGSYTVTITDANGCTLSRNATVSQPSAALSSSVSSNQPVSCYGGANGSIVINVSGGTPGYSYNWSNGATTQNISGLTAGVYSVTITDVNGCTVQQSATITQPASALNASASASSQVSCYGGNDGSVILNVSGGTPSYTYNWSNGSTVQSPSGLSTGNYAVIVTDANGCTATASVNVSQPSAALSASAGTTQNVNCYGESTGSITLNVSGGTPAYSYNWSNGATSQNISSLPSGTYTVVVTDVNSCTASVSVLITQPSSPLVSSSTVSQQVSCYAGANGAITVTVNGGTSPYNYLWSNGATVQNINGLAAGTYTVTITDSKGCTSVQTKTVTQPAAALSVSASASSQVSCHAGNNGSISLTVSGGTSPYTYSWSNGSTVQNPTGLAAGVYSVTVTDANGCTFTATATITQPTAALNTSAGVSQQVNCFGGNNGSITLTVTGGTSPYTYNWSSGQTTQNISGMQAGTYTATATDANGCTSVSSATITQPAAALSSGSTVSQQVSCYAGNNGAINVSVSGGTAPYSYLWNTGATTQNLSSLAAGTYTLTITDANGCTNLQTQTITQPSAALSGSTTVTSNISCYSGNNGSINLTVSGGTSPYTFAWNTGATTQNLSGLAAGNYSVIITDANNCTASASATISQPAGALSASISVSQGVLCHGGNNGTVAITVTGGTSPYNYIWNTGATSSSITGLAAGNYTATITDANGCNASITATISQPSAALSLTSTVNSNVSCYGGNNGSVTVNPSGGTSPYTYNWSNGATTQNITNLTSGAYSVTVTDANGCTQTLSANITQPSGSLTATLQSSQNVSCYGGTNGSVQVNVTQGTSPYTYNWSNGATTQNINGLAAGSYSVTVTDANGCTQTLSANITQPSGALTATLQSSQNVSCYGGANGSIQVNVTQGTSPYTYNWSNGATTQNISGLTAGSYSVTVTDANGCTQTLSANITQPSGALTATLQSSQNVSCYGGTNGSVQVNVTQGTSPYTYNWSNGATTQNINGLAAGSYSVTVTDANGCTQTLSANITQPSGALTATLQSTQNVSCYGGTNGSIQVNVTQGTSPYTYNWSNGATTQSINGLAAGSYSITVTDANGCTQTLSANITQPTGALTATLQSSQNVSCFGGANGSIQVNVTQGTSPYTYNWSNGATTQNISNLPSGTYSVTVTDANGCTENLTATISQPAAALNGNATVTSNISCYSGNNGTVTLTINGGTQPYSYLWSNGTTTQDLTNVGAGTYSVTVSDANGCTFQTTATIVQPAGALGTSVNINQNVSCYAGNDGMVTLNVTGGTLPYTFNWSNGATTQNISNLGSGTYTVTVTDANGCFATSAATVSQPAGALNVNLSTTQNVSCYGGSNGEITATVTMGTAPYQYNWSNGATTQNLTNVPYGLYTVTITDANGCTEVQTAYVSQPYGPLQVSLQATQNVSCYGYADGEITMSVGYGTPPYTFQWSNGATTQDISNLAAGTYTVTVTDANGCTEIQTQQITQPSGALNVSLVSLQNINCYGGNNGEIIVNVIQGTSPYTFNWSNGATTQNITNLTMGSYTVTVTDANGCTETLSQTLTEPAGALSAYLASQQNVNCYGGTDAIIDVEVMSGTPPYSYLWNTGDVTQDLTNVPAGTYTVTVTDANGCTEVLTTTVIQPAGALNANISSTQNIGCYGASTGNINLLVSMGTAPYTYQWSNGATTQSLTNVPAGTYTVTVTDYQGCTETLSATLTQPQGALNATIQSIGGADCRGNSSGSVTIQVVQGTAPYSYLWSNGATTQNLNGVSSGTYTVTVTDANGCTQILTATVTQPAGSLSATLQSSQNVSCYGGANGSITINVSQGTAPYTYQWSNGATTQNISSLAAGTYTVTVTDANGCLETLSAAITEPQGALSVSLQSSQNISCYGGNNGSIQLTVNAGTAPYTYNWSNGATTQNLSNLTAGMYTVTVTDVNGCTESQTITLTQPQGALQISVSSSHQVSCYNGTDGQITVNVIQGTPPYSYAWNNGAIGTTVTGLSAGTYTVTVTDANGCTETMSATITQPQQALMMTGNTSSSNCLAGIGGSISVNPVGGTAPYSYNWTNGANTQNLTNVSQGSYTVLITDANGCTAQSEFTVTDLSTFNAQADGPTTICVGSLAYLIADSIPGASYQWYLNGQTLGGATYPHFVTPVAGSYTVTIQHACGTFTSQPINITVNSAANITVSPNVIICPGESTQLLASGGVNYTWTPATGLDYPNVPNPVASPPSSITYTVEVENAEGCRATAQVMVTVFCDTLIIPSGYSPNNDGVNDGFVIVGIEKYPNNKIWIYNRWGNLVYKASGYNNDWSGYSNVSGIYIGKKVPAGTYFYVLDLGDDKKPRQGYIVLRY
ncbi:MAG: gliding motility-associated C-terminal domain-containing protein [Bacteroidia bacterium]|nr:gliding motility-associated C-terminal domain-containing protein [Bacteroidia bacterium]